MLGFGTYKGFSYQKRGVKRMGLGKIAAETAVDLVKSENIQNKTADILGMLFPYAGIEKRALEMYVSDVEKSDMTAESKLIAVLNAKQTIKKLKNQKGVAEKAVANAKEGTVFDASSGVEQEWFERFMDSAGFVSDEQVQMMWGKILAKEFETPGSTPLNMIRILTEITPKYAQAFQKICSMRRLLVTLNSNGEISGFRNDIVVPYKDGGEKMREIGLTFDILNEIETLGLIKFDTVGGFVALKMPETGILTYTNGITKEISKHNDDKIPIGNVMLTDAGECLSRITQPIEISDYEVTEKAFMIQNGVTYKDSTEYHIFKDQAGSFKLVKVPIVAANE